MTFTLPALMFITFFAIGIALVGVTRFGRAPTRAALLWSISFAAGASGVVLSLGAMPMAY